MSAPDPGWIRQADRCYAVLLRLYPRRFRERWGDEMRLAFRDRCREIASGQRPPLAQAIALASDLLAGAGREQYIAFTREDSIKRVLALALAFGIAGALLFHERVASGTTAAGGFVQGVWNVYQRRMDDRAWDRYAQDIAHARLAGQPDAHDHAVAGILLASAGRDDRQARERASAQWRKAVASGDPTALWLTVVDCPVETCDAEGALARLVAREGDDASVALLELHTAIPAGDPTRIREAFERLAGTTHATEFAGDALRSLIQAASLVAPPARLSRRHAGSADPAGLAAFELAAGLSMAMPLPNPRPLLDYCDPLGPDGPARRGDCLLAATRLRETGSFVDHRYGNRIALRYAGDSAALAVARQRVRDLNWQQAFFARHGNYLEEDGALRIRDAWLAGGSEMVVIRRLMRQAGEPLAAPPDFEVDPHDLDPAL